VRIRLGRSLSGRLKGRIEQYQFEVGILDDKVHYEAQSSALGNEGVYAGGPVRLRERTKVSEAGTISKVSELNRERLGFNYLREPFKNTGSDIIRFTQEFLKMAMGRSKEKRVTNLIQAIVRNPILRGDYGSNTSVTAKIKGFDRLMMDTGQLFKNIKARIIKRGRNV
jgi:hypothetical protein